MFAVILDEVRKMARNPRRLLMVFQPRRWRQFFGVVRFDSQTGNRWKSVSGESQFKKREYASYEQYLQHQQSKLQHLDLAEYDRNYRRLLNERLRKIPELKAGANVLCLGARQGTEVRAFLDLGCTAIGVDLNPGPDNPHVVQGDFHNLQFGASSMDVIFTNSLDHVFDMRKVTDEIKRVLKPGGLLIIEAIRGEEEETSPDHYASFWWKKTDDLVALLAKDNFKVVHRAPFSEPWPGEQICFEFIS